MLPCLLGQYGNTEHSWQGPVDADCVRCLPLQMSLQMSPLQTAVLLGSTAATDTAV